MTISIDDIRQILAEITIKQAAITATQQETAQQIREFSLQQQKTDQQLKEVSQEIKEVSLLTKSRSKTFSGEVY